MARSNSGADLRVGLRAKRVLDVAVAAVGLGVFSPVIVVVAMAVRLSSGRPVLFRQVRPGLHGQPFVIYKFRTLRDMRDVEGRPLPDEERLDPLGTWLRATSLDELPSLWNVLRGDMSLVGPRPLLMEYLPLYDAVQARRHEVRPGLTGWAQVCGRNAVSWEERFQLDVWYVDHRSMALDLRILFRTLRLVAERQGINEPGQATMSPFRKPT